VEQQWQAIFLFQPAFKRLIVVVNDPENLHRNGR
jgi:hypothetical protein